MKHVIAGTWNGHPISRKHWVSVDLALKKGELVMNLDSPFYDNPKPGGPAGPTDGLWDFEVVELFLSGDGNRYLEVELGPHGHHLALILEGKRNIIEKKLPLEYTALIRGSRWRGTAAVPAAYIPGGRLTGNLYAIYGPAEARIHLALYPLGGDAPDFHRLEDFRPLLP
jgi:hypothetical protein